MKELASRNIRYTGEIADERVRDVLFDLNRARTSADVIDHALDTARRHVNAREIVQAQGPHLTIRADARELESHYAAPWWDEDPRFLNPVISPNIAKVRAAARAMAGAPAVVRARDRQLALALAQADTGELHGDLDRAHAMASDLQRDHALGRHLTRDLASDLDRARNRTRDLIRTLNRARSIDQARTRAPVSDFDRGRTATDGLTYACNLASDLHLLLSSIIDRVSGVHMTLKHPSVAAKENRSRRVTRPAARLTNAAVGLLPRRDRDRYAEEYRSELTDLATAGAGRWQQLIYAGRLLARTVSLRSALTQRRRRRKSV